MEGESLAMPSIKLNITSAGAETLTNVVDGLKFSKLEVPHAITIYGSSSLEGTSMNASVDSTEFVNSAILNVESGTGIVETDRDAIVSREVVPAGQLFIAITVGGAAGTNILVVLEPLVS